MGKEDYIYDEVSGGFNFSNHNAGRERSLAFAVDNDLKIGNTFFVKRDSHLLTDHSGLCKS